MSTKSVYRLAALVVGAEGIGIVALLLWQVSALADGDTESLSSAIALVVLTAVGAIAVIAFAVAIARGQSWGRSGGIVTQVLIAAVALGAATGAYAHPLIGLGLAVPALVGFILLVMAARRAAADLRKT
ncbi:histidine kinase [Microbacterium sp. P02]|uniref:histidine kinase n=1 Tax=unclassified Microbacterium TaxID=2609290 RepID=UPI003670530A